MSDTTVSTVSPRSARSRAAATGSQGASVAQCGTSSSAGLETSYPLLRSRMANAYVAAYYDHKKFDNQALGVSTACGRPKTS